MLTPGRSRVLAVDPMVTLAFAPRLAVQVWRKDVTPSHLLVLGRELRDFIPMCRGKRYASITVIEQGISLRMSDEVRSASEALQRELAPHIQCMAYVVTHEGFVAAAARTVATGFALVTRAPYPLKVCATPTEAANWVAGQIELGPAEIENVLIDARKK